MFFEETHLKDMQFGIDDFKYIGIGIYQLYRPEARVIRQKITELPSRIRRFVFFSNKHFSTVRISRHIQTNTMPRGKNIGSEFPIGWYSLKNTMDALLIE